MTHRHESTANGRTASLWGWSVGIECQACNRRALVPLDRLGVFDGDMRALTSLRLVCSGCGGLDAAFWIVPPSARDDWLTAKIE